MNRQEIISECFSLLANSSSIESGIKKSFELFFSKFKEEAKGTEDQIIQAIDKYDYIFKQYCRLSNAHLISRNNNTVLDESVFYFSLSAMLFKKDIIDRINHISKLNS